MPALFGLGGIRPTIRRILEAVNWFDLKTVTILVKATRQMGAECPHFADDALGRVPQ